MDFSELDKWLAKCAPTVNKHMIHTFINDIVANLPSEEENKEEQTPSEETPSDQTPSDEENQGE